mgnify:CR=1 FL=1|jgi:hypothetical protein|tara:strand:- start:1878 stop:2078 length:201 start_codon:yes stop_codon:yes gene_type:complete
MEINKEENKQRVLEWLTTPPKGYEYHFMRQGEAPNETGEVLIRTPDMTDDQWAEIRHQHIMKHGDF